jgi:prepilin-type N-terminal cleavage/methylation domain-containing protein
VADPDPCCTSADCTESAARDQGVSLIEILISVVLLGLAVTAMLSTLQITIHASATERDHANAHAWLQTASDVVYRMERMECGTDGAVADEDAVREFYQGQIWELADNPEDWPDAKIEVIEPVLFWNGTVYQDICYYQTGLQLVTIRVRNLNDEIVETVQVVKG